MNLITYFVSKHSVNFFSCSKKLHLKMVLNEKLPIPSVWELFQSIPNIRLEWCLKTPLQKWSYLYGIGKATCLIVKIPFYEEDQTLSLWAYQGIVYIGAYFILAIYTLFYHFIRDESIKCLPCTCLLGLIIAVSLKLNLFSMN